MMNYTSVTHTPNTNNNNNNNTSTKNGHFKLNIYFTNIILILYTLVFIIGIIGNTFACAVVLIKHSMRRSIHLYTFNLSLADIIIILVYVPTQMKFIKDELNWEMGDVVCSLAYAIIPLSLQASVGTLVAISIDRFRGLIYPFSWRADSKRNSKIIIPVIWMISIAIAFPIAYFAKVETDPSDKTHKTCWENLPRKYEGDRSFDFKYWTTVMILQYILPFLIIAVVHIYMTIRIANSSNTINALHKRMMLMVIVLLITYLICTGMQHLFFYMDYYGKDFLATPYAPYLYIISNLLITLQAAINPLIYCTSRNDFKDAYTELMKKLLSITRKRICKSTSVSLNGHKNNTESTAGSVTPIMWRKCSIKKEVLRDNPMLLPLNSIDETRSPTLLSRSLSSRTNPCMESCLSPSEKLDVQKRWSHRLETLAYLDVESFSDHMKSKRNKRFKYKRSSSTKKLSTSSNTPIFNESLSPVYDEFLPKIHISSPSNSPPNNNVFIFPSPKMNLNGVLMEEGDHQQNVFKEEETEFFSEYKNYSEDDFKQYRFSKIIDLEESCI